MNSLPTPQNINRLWSLVVVDQLVKNGATTFYTCPGLRNAPFLWAVEVHPGARLISGVDERAHAYRALGHAKETGKTSVLVCTSGTALTNFTPALAEAHKSHTPLMVMSADRPPELNWSDANQTLEQKNVYSNWTRAQKDWGTPHGDVPLESLASMTGYLWEKSQYPLAGPVHLNCPFREPLDSTKTMIPEQRLREWDRLSKEAFARRRSPRYETMVHPEDFEQIKKQLTCRLDRPDSVLTIIGELSPWKSKEELEKFCADAPWPLYADVTSGFKYEFPLEKGGVPTFDHPEVFRWFDDNPPEVILHLGRRLVSKHYYRWLAAHPEVTLIQVAEHSENIDPAWRTAINIQMDPEDFCRQLRFDGTGKKRENTLRWKNFVENKSSLIDHHQETGKGVTFPELSKNILESVRENSRLYLGNSTTIRSFDSFASLDLVSSHRVFAHRGASGIEGFLSAAIGAWDADPSRPLILVLGDLSLYHDLGALMTLKECWRDRDTDKHAPFITIVANNFQGGIFNLLPVGQEKEIKSALCTPHELEFSAVCESLGFTSVQVKNISDFRQCFEKAQEKAGPSFIEVFVDDEENQKLYQSLRTIRM